MYTAPYAAVTAVTFPHCGDTTAVIAIAIILAFVISISLIAVVMIMMITIGSAGVVTFLLRYCVCAVLTSSAMTSTDAGGSSTCTTSTAS